LVSPYFAEKCDKIEAHQEAIFTCANSLKIASPVASIFVAFYNKIEATGEAILVNGR
jgi:hypothetical protein